MKSHRARRSQKLLHPLKKKEIPPGVLSKKERHHTMFFSDSTRQSDMRIAKERLLNIWQRSAYSSERGLTVLTVAWSDSSSKTKTLKFFRSGVEIPRSIAFIRLLSRDSFFLIITTRKIYENKTVILFNCLIFINFGYE